MYQVFVEYHFEKKDWFQGKAIINEQKIFLSVGILVFYCVYIYMVIWFIKKSKSNMIMHIYSVSCWLVCVY